MHEGSIIAGKYRLERVLARGGMGAVWMARHLQLGMAVAIKFMDPTFADLAEGRSRFEREAKAAALIQSPNVVQIHDYGVEEGTPYIAMELLTGEDLGSRLRRERRLPIRVTASLVTQVCKALRKAHEAGVIHRDLKPANVFLVRGDDDEVVKVLDFGIAKITGVGAAEDATKTGVVLGSVHYMSPEQARGTKEIDARSDLWSLAVIAYRALTAHFPFPGDQLGDVIVKICTDPIPLPSQYLPELGGEVDRFFKRALARIPDERFQNAREFAAAFAELAGSRAEMSSSLWNAPALPAEPALTPAPFSAVTPPAMAESAPVVTSPAPVSSPMVGTLTSATQASDILVREPPRKGPPPFAIVAVSAVAVVALAIGGMALFGGGQRSAAEAPTTVAAPEVAPSISQTAPRPEVAPSPVTTGPQAALRPDPTPSAPNAPPTASASASAAAATGVPRAAAPPKAPVGPPRKVNAKLGF
jgi:serine/threonine-protein kinase